MNKIKKSITHLDYFRRHLFNFYPYLTPKKIMNLFLNVIEMHYRINTPKSLPLYIKVEPTPLCQLRCLGCSHRLIDYNKQLNNSMHLTLQHLKKIIDPISDTLLGVSLSLSGEPMLNKDIISFIEYIHNKNIAVSFPTNFSIKLNGEQIERLANSGLDSIMVSLDGASEEAYSIYRVGGRFNLILKNVRLLSEAKEKYGLKRPKIIWKFVIFDHNRHEIEIVKKQYKSLGFDSYELGFDFRSGLIKRTSKSYKKNMVNNKKPCYWLWHTMIIKWDGSVLPCCKVSHDKFNIGNAVRDDIVKIWRNNRYKALRNGFSKKNYGKSMHPICKRCMRI